MGIFYLGPLMGPLVGPIIGGALAQSLGWRSTQWFLAIFGGVILAVLFFVLPEVNICIQVQFLLLTKISDPETSSAQD